MPDAIAPIIKAIDVPDGFPDWFGGWHGRPIAFEVKRTGKEPRPNQQAWLDRLARWGYATTCVHSLAEFIEFVEEAEAVATYVSRHCELDDMW